MLTLNPYKTPTKEILLLSPIWQRRKLRHWASRLSFRTVRAEPEFELRVQTFHQDFNVQLLINLTLWRVPQRCSTQVLSCRVSPQSTLFIQAKRACDQSFLIKAIIFPSLPDITDQSLSHVQQTIPIVSDKQAPTKQKPIRKLPLIFWDLP